MASAPARRPSTAPRCSSRPSSQADEPLALRRARRTPAACQVDDLADAHRARALRAARARRRRELRRRRPVLALRRPARPGRGPGPAGRARRCEAVGEATGETVNLAHRPRRAGRAGRPGRLARSCSAPATGPRSTSRRTARRSARSSSPAARSPLPPGALERAPTDTITDRRRAARASSSAAAARGCAVTVDELEVGLAGVAAPVLGARRQVVAALGISGPPQRLEDRLDELGRLLIHHAAELSELLRGNTASPITKEGAA